MLHSYMLKIGHSHHLAQHLCQARFNSNDWAIQCTLLPLKRLQAASNGTHYDYGPCWLFLPSNDDEHWICTQIYYCLWSGWAKGGTFCNPAQAKWATLGINDVSDANNKAKAGVIMVGEVKAFLSINNLSVECHGEFKRSLANAYTSGADSCPATIGDATFCAS